MLLYKDLDLLPYLFRTFGILMQVLYNGIYELLQHVIFKVIHLPSISYILMRIACV